MDAEQCVHCVRPQVRGVILCASPHWLEAGDTRWRNLDGTARVMVVDACKDCGHGERKPKRRTDGKRYQDF